MAKIQSKRTDTIKAMEKLALDVEDSEEATAIYDIYKETLDRVRRQQVRALSRGTYVSFPLRRGGSAIGRIVKVNKKTVAVDAVEGYGSWNVAPEILTVLEGEDAESADAKWKERPAALRRGL